MTRTVDSSAPPVPRRLAFASAALTVVLVIAVVLTPWRATALEIRDFSEFLPLLESSPDIGEQWRGLTTYYRSQGRANALTNAVILTFWRLGGESPVAWQTLQLGLLIVAALGLLYFLVRCGVHLFAASALVIATLLAVGPAEAALRLTMELLVAALLVAAMWGGLAAGRTAGLPRMLSIVVLSAVLVLSKEAMFVLVPLVLAAVIAGGAEAHWKKITVVAVAVVTLCLVTRAAVASAQAPAEAYTRGLRIANVNLNSILAAALGLIAPGRWPWAHDPLAVPWIHGFWSAVLALGFLLAWNRGFRALIAGLVISLCCGVALYAAWGRFELFYAAPFTVAMVSVAGVGLGSSSDVRGRRGIPLGAIVWLLALHSAANAWRLKEVTFARRSVEFEVVQQVSRLEPLRVVFFPTHAVPAQPWQSDAATMRRFIRAAWPERDPPDLRTVRCDELSGSIVAERPVAAVIYRSGDCLDADRMISTQYAYLRLWPPGVDTGRFAIGVVGF